MTRNLWHYEAGQTLLSFPSPAGSDIMPAVQCRHNVQFLVRSSFTQASWICEITNFFLKTVRPVIALQSRWKALSLSCVPGKLRKNRQGNGTD
uniref:Uncharacterized protein n=1 Tax=Anguilla anguilla TaxID=7936 RepID=A0A0E9SFD5_ANGAN